jgi:hypothetical protein
MLRFGLAVFTALLLFTDATACSVPVLRYALENWSPSKYEVVVYHRGPLAAADAETVRRLEAVVPGANVGLTDVDLAGNVPPALQKLWDRIGKDSPLPRLVLRYPDSGEETPVAWAGALSEGNVNALVESPARRRVFERLTAGQAGVVVLLLSGDEATDARIREMLGRELPRIAGRIELPKPTPDGPQVRSELPVRIEFPVVEVGRTPAEDVLVRILLGSEDGLDQVKGPIVFPVFGRGRALCSLYGNDLDKPEDLRRSLEFLCRACSCQVKELNPGVDLLMAGDWDVVFDAERGPAPREVVGVVPSAAPHEAATKPEPTEPRSPPPPGYAAAEINPGSATTPVRWPWHRIGTIGALVLVLVTGAWVLRTRRPEQHPAS